MVEISKSQNIFPWIIFMIDFEIGMLSINVFFEMSESDKYSNSHFYKTAALLIMFFTNSCLNIYSCTKVSKIEAKDLTYSHFFFPKYIGNALLLLQVIYAFVDFMLLTSDIDTIELYIYKRLYLLAFIILNVVQILFDIVTPFLYIKLRNFELPKVGLLL